MLPVIIYSRTDLVWIIWCVDVKVIPDVVAVHVGVADHRVVGVLNGRKSLVGLKIKDYNFYRVQNKEQN